MVRVEKINIHTVNDWRGLKIVQEQWVLSSTAPVSWKTCVYVCIRYAMKCLDKKRIKMKQGETLALNERIMLSLVSTGVSLTHRFLSVHMYIHIHTTREYHFQIDLSDNII